MTPEDYVSYPLALALKKAGFDEPCHYGYSVKMRLEPEISFGEPKMVHSKTPKNYNDNRKGIAKGLEFCSAVPLWQAQKWLRNVHKFDMNIDLDDDTDEPYTTEIYKNKECVVGFWKLGFFAAYESALSAGIAAALELVEKKGE